MCVCVCWGGGGGGGGGECLCEYAGNEQPLITCLAMRHH